MTRLHYPEYKKLGSFIDAAPPTAGWGFGSDRYTGCWQPQQQGWAPGRSEMISSGEFDISQ